MSRTLLVTVQDLGLAGLGTSGDQVLLEAVNQGRTVLTMNRQDFKNLRKQYQSAGQDHTGIIICTRDRHTSALAQRIHDEIQQTGDLTIQLLRIVRPNP